jgi:hypothetical protein
MMERVVVVVVAEMEVRCSDLDDVWWGSQVGGGMKP